MASFHVTCFDMEEFLHQYVDPQVLKLLQGVSHAVVFVNFENQYPDKVCSNISSNINIVGVRASEPRSDESEHSNAKPEALETISFHGRHMSYNVPQLPFWRPPPLLSQLYIIKSLGVPVNPYRHFVSPSVVDLATYMWESGATSLDVFTEYQGHPKPAFRFELTCPVRVVTGTVTSVKWCKANQSADHKLQLPVEYTNVVCVECDGEEISVPNVAHRTVHKGRINRGAVLKVVVADGVIPHAQLVCVEEPGKRARMPRTYRWVDHKCCLPWDMERAMEMRHTCVRLGMPSTVPLQLFLVLVKLNLKTLHPLLVDKTAVINHTELRKHGGHAELCQWIKGLTMSLAEIMHCSGAFAPEWGLLRLAIMCNCTGAKTDPNSFFNSWKLGKDYSFVRGRWDEFEAFLNRHTLWTAAVEFDTSTFVKPLKSKNPLKKTRKRGEQVKGGLHQFKGLHPHDNTKTRSIPIGESAPYILMHSDKPHPSPPNDLSCPC